MDQLSNSLKEKEINSVDSRRLFHGRGQCYPGYEDLLIDWYPPVVFVTLYKQRSSVWFDELQALLFEHMPMLEAIVVQERYQSGSPSRMIYGCLPDPVDAVEDGLKYRLNLMKAQNIGFFPDMKFARRYLYRQAAGKRVLNLFAYTCSFSVVAMSGAAKQVVNLDMSRTALERGRENHQINELDLRNVSFLPMEFFRSFSRLKKLAPFDLVVCDPPGEQGDSFNAARDWPKLIRKVPALIAPGGLMICCVSHPHVQLSSLVKCFECEWPQAFVLETLEAGDDFLDCSPGRGSRALIAQIGRGPNIS